MYQVTIYAVQWNGKRVKEWCDDVNFSDMIDMVTAPEYMASGQHEVVVLPLEGQDRKHSAF